jgi:hypothetical protein
MNPKRMVYLINADFERRREEEWLELHRRPDALPLPPEEPRVGIRTRLSAAVRAFVDPLLLERPLPPDHLSDDAPAA